MTGPSAEAASSGPTARGSSRAQAPFGRVMTEAPGWWLAAEGRCPEQGRVASWGPTEEKRRLAAAPSVGPGRRPAARWPSGHGGDGRSLEGPFLSYRSAGQACFGQLGYQATTSRSGTSSK